MLHLGCLSFYSTTCFQINRGEMIRSGIRGCLPFVSDPDSLKIIMSFHRQGRVLVWISGICVTSSLVQAFLTIIFSN